MLVRSSNCHSGGRLWVSKEDYDKAVSELSTKKADLAQAKGTIAELEKSVSEAPAQQKALSEALAQQKAASEAQAQALLDAALKTFQGFMRDKNYEYLHNNIKNANAGLIYPRILKAGFILGGSGGTGVLVARDATTGNWCQPDFYTIGSVSFGLQIGGESASPMAVGSGSTAKWGWARPLPSRYR